MTKFPNEPQTYVVGTASDLEFVLTLDNSEGTESALNTTVMIWSTRGFQLNQTDKRFNSTKIFSEHTVPEARISYLGLRKWR